MLPNENLKNLSPKYGQKKNRNYANVSVGYLLYSWKYIKGINFEMMAIFLILI